MYIMVSAAAYDIFSMKDVETISSVAEQEVAARLRAIGLESQMILGGMALATCRCMNCSGTR